MLHQTPPRPMWVAPKLVVYGDANTMTKTVIKYVGHNDGTFLSIGLATVPEGPYSV